MKNIELTEKHKTKLLEMCEVLFPEYIIQDWGLTIGRPDGGFLRMWLKEPQDSKVNFIHWFEFCVNNLISKVLSPLKPDGYPYECMLADSLCNCVKGRTMHLVDYLYYEFKKIKND